MRCADKPLAVCKSVKNNGVPPNNLEEILKECTNKFLADALASTLCWVQRLKASVSCHGQNAPKHPWALSSVRELPIRKFPYTSCEFSWETKPECAHMLHCVLCLTEKRSSWVFLFWGAPIFQQFRHGYFRLNRRWWAILWLWCRGHCTVWSVSRVQHRCR